MWVSRRRGLAVLLLGLCLAACPPEDGRAFVDGKNDDKDGGSAGGGRGGDDDNDRGGGTGPPNSPLPPPAAPLPAPDSDIIISLDGAEHTADEFEKLMKRSPPEPPMGPDGSTAPEAGGVQDGATAPAGESIWEVVPSPMAIEEITVTVPDVIPGYSGGFDFPHLDEDEKLPMLPPTPPVDLGVADLSDNVFIAREETGPVEVKCGGVHCSLSPHGGVGRYLLAYGGAQVHMENVTMTGWKAGGGSALVLVNSTATFRNVEFKGNEATDGFLGGAVLAINSTAVFHNCRFTDNSATSSTGFSSTESLQQAMKEAEALAPNASNLETLVGLLDYRMALNEVELHGGGLGGAVAQVGVLSNVTMVDCILTNNTANGGGAIYAMDGQLAMIGSTLESNVGMFEGGSVIAVEGARVFVAESSFRDSRAPAGCGGAFSLSSASLAAVGITVTDSSAGVCGGVAAAGRASQIQILNSKLMGTTSTAGGALFISNNTLAALRGCNVMDARAATFGGVAVVAGASTLRATNVTSSSPQAGIGGAHLAVSTGSAVMALDVSMLSGSVAGGCCKISALSALPTCTTECPMDSPMSAGGGAVQIESGGKVWCSSCRVSSNINGGGDGGAFSVNGNSFLAVYDSTLDNNVVMGNGSAIHAEDDSFVTLESTAVKSTLWRRSDSVMYFSDSSVNLDSSSFELALLGKLSMLRSAGIFFTGMSTAAVEGNRATALSGDTIALTVVAHGQQPQVYMADNSGMSFSGERPPVPCRPFTCLFTGSFPPSCLTFDPNQQAILSAMDSDTPEVVPDGNLPYCHPYDALTATQAAPQSITVVNPQECSTEDAPLCLASSLSEVTTCASPCGGEEPSTNSGLIVGIIAACVIVAALLVAASVLFALKHKKWRRHSRTESLSLTSLGKRGSTTNVADLEATSMPKPSQHGSPHNSPDSDEYITYNSRAPSPLKGGAEMSLVVLDGGSVLSPEESKGLSDARGSAHAAVTRSPSQVSKGLSDAGGSAHAAVTRSPSSQAEINTDVDFELEILPNLTKANFIGAGGFGEVYRMDWRGHRVAVKVFPSSFCGPSDQQYESYLMELKLLARFQDIPQIVRLWGACLQRPHMALVYELVEGGSLAHRIHNGPPMSITEIIQAGYDIAVGLSHLHPTVVHRDLKPGNVLVGRDGTCKLIDFGLSRGKDPFVSYLSTEAGGTPNYMSPEVFSGSHFDEKVDVWSLGMILYECLTRSMPFSDCHNLAQIVFAISIQRDRPELPEGTPWPLARLVKKCWADEPYKRPSAHEIARLLQIMLDDRLGEGGASSLFPGDINSSSENSQASSDTITRQARTKAVLAAAAAAGPEAEQALRDQLHEAGMDSFVLTPFGSGANSSLGMPSSLGSGEPAPHLLA